jgi:hypothetical protein
MPQQSRLDLAAYMIAPILLSTSAMPKKAFFRPGF